MADKPTGENRELFLEYLKKFCLMDDTFMRKYFQDSIECTEEILHIILDNKDIKIIQNDTQHLIASLQGKEIVLDMYASSASEKYNVEMQNKSKGANPKRTRYHSSMIDSNILEKGAEPIDLPTTYVIFITKNDYFGKGLPIYHIKRYIEEMQEVFDDGTNIIYINGDYENTSTDLGKLIHDFKCTQAKDMFNAKLKNRMSELKETAEGVEVMCELMEDLRQKGIEIGEQRGIEIGEQRGELKKQKEFAIKLLKKGTMSLEEIADITELSMEEILTLVHDKTN